MRSSMSNGKRHCSRESSSGMEWTFFPARAMRYMACMWIRCRLLIQTVDSRQSHAHAGIRAQRNQLVEGGGRKLGIWRHNQQFFMNKAMLRPLGQIIDNRFVWFSYSSFKMAYFQRPHWVYGSFSPPLKFPGLIQISYIDEWGKLFFIQAYRSGIGRLLVFSW